MAMPCFFTVMVFHRNFLLRTIEQGLADVRDGISPRFMVEMRR